MQISKTSNQPAAGRRKKTRRPSFRHWWKKARPLTFVLLCVIAAVMLIPIVFTFLYVAGVYWMGGEIVSFGVILAMGSYVSRFWQPITNLANIYNSFVNNIAYLERIFETMDEPVEVKDVPGAEPLKALDGEVTFENVEFGYEKGQTVLENLNLHVRAGERIALVGPTGAGKSTVINLLCRFYNLRGGRILLHCADGTTQDIAGATLHSLRSQLGIMLQDSFLFAGTIMDNIRYGRLDATDEEVIAAAKAVRAHEFIAQMPQQYATPVNERGGGLSQGQRQLIAFARTLLSDPRILILDEATSSIDTQTERLLQQGIETLLQGRTSFIVAHRLSTIKSCDRILYIGNKGILESGSHDELMAKKGIITSCIPPRRRRPKRETKNAPHGRKTCGACPLQKIGGNLAFRIDCPLTGRFTMRGR